MLLLLSVQYPRMSKIFFFFAGGVASNAFDALDVLDASNALALAAEQYACMLNVFFAFIACGFVAATFNFVFLRRGGSNRCSDSTQADAPSSSTSSSSLSSSFPYFQRRRFFKGKQAAGARKASSFFFKDGDADHTCSAVNL